MNVLSWVLFGLVAGAVARLVVPGSQRIGCLGTLAVGIAGALLGGFLGELLFDEEIEFGWDLRPFLLAVGGAVLLLLLLGALGRRR
ncbi:MAG: GlsB/YeaQ/YmgE family stress response membrane protein [Thermoleophilia bacterium]|nr:GlsB/YeaQ/YmgE family stress response membrane protein [Thermoleophilia bacterium]